MSFMSAVRKASPGVFGDYLSNMLAGFFESAFGDADLEGFIFFGALYLILCVVWLVVLGIVSTVSELVSRSGF